MKIFRIKIIFNFFWVFIFASGCEKTEAPTKFNGNALPDTTSHDFTWQIDVLGDGEASYLRDASIIDENNVWAVGSIYFKDSTGQFIYPAFGAAHWNGAKWEFKRLPAQAPGYTTYLTPNGIFAFAPDDIWFAHGGVHHYDGRQIRSFWVNSFPGNANAILDSGQFIDKIWGTSSSNLWAVGTRGAIIHFDGTAWQKLESGTTQDIQDIWGIVDENTKEQKILCPVSNKYHGGEKRVLQILPNNQVVDFDWTPQRVAYSIWFLENTPIYACGGAFFRYENKQWIKVTALPNIFQNRVRGNNQNDVFVVGDFGVFAHYNGKSWKVYDSLSLPQGNYEGLAVKDNLVVAVGWNGDRAVVVRGKRKQSSK